MKEALELPNRTLDEMLASEFGELIAVSTSLGAQAERAALEATGADRRFTVGASIPALVYAAVARCCWAMASAAEISGTEFDPVAFGRSAERIARERIAGYEQYLAEEKANNLRNSQPAGRA